MTLSAWLDALSAATRDADGAEERLRAEFARRVATLAEERAFAYRRLNLMRAVADAAASAPDEETAVSHGLAVLRARLGWTTDSEARTEILGRFAPVCAAAFGSLAAEGEAEPPDPAAALAGFESWYRDAKGSAFWNLFENHMPETPVVDF